MRTIISISRLVLTLACVGNIASAAPVPAVVWEVRETLKMDMQERFGHSKYLNLLAAQGMQESGWDTNATSPVGAIGCFQFMPRTAKDAKQWAQDLGDFDPRDCRQSARAAIRYMHYIYKQIEGSECYRYTEALKDFNRGIGWGAKERRAGVCLRNATACEETDRYVANIVDRWQTHFAQQEFSSGLTCLDELI